MTYIFNFLPCGAVLLRLAAAEGLFLFGIKKKQKMPAENFSFKASRMAGAVEPEKFVRPDLCRTEMWCFGLAGREMHTSSNCSLINNYKITSMVAQNL